MRSVVAISLILLFLSGCGSSRSPQTPEEAVIPMPKMDEGAPIGTVVFRDGSTLELASLNKMDEFYIHITGKLNGRASTLIQLTRVDDLRAWKGITFEDQRTFTIVTRANKEFRFTDGNMYIGNGSDASYTFMTSTPGSLAQEEISVPKSEVKLININEPRYLAP